MNIENMSDSEKSVILAKLNPAWKVKEFNSFDGRQAVVSDADNGRVLFRLSKKHNFFTVDENGDPHLMPQAWRVHCWTCETSSSKNKADRNAKYNLFDKYDDWFRGYGDGLYDPNFQRAWLDKILSLVIEAGMMGVSE